MSTARDAGMAALQSGDIQTAITQLEAAVQEDPSDYEASLYLGGAYGQAGRPSDAIKLVTQAVQLQPANAQARYNLGVAMEQGGYNEQALQVYGQALHLQPDYPNAQQAVDRLHASSNQGFGSPVSSSPTVAGSGQQFQEEQTLPGPKATQQYAQPAAFGQQEAGYNPLAPEPEQQPAQPPQMFGAPTQQSPAFARPAAPVGQPQQPVEAGLGSYMAPPPAAARAGGGYGAPAASGARPGAYSSTPSYDDEFKLGQAFKDFFRALFTPRVLFSEMEGCGTSRSAWALFLVYAVFAFIVAAISGVLRKSSGGSDVMVNQLIQTAKGVGGLLVIWVLFASIVHVLSRAFGSSLSYGGSVRCVIYSAAPFMASVYIFTIVGAVLAPQMQKAADKSGIKDMAAASQSAASGGSDGKKSANKGSKNGKSGSSKRSTSVTGGGNFASSGNKSDSAGSSGGSSYGAPEGSPADVGNGSNPSGADTAGFLQAMFAFGAIFTVILAVGVLWGIGLLAVAISGIHQVSGGAAAGVVILSCIISGVVGIGGYVAYIAPKVSNAINQARQQQ